MLLRCAREPGGTWIGSGLGPDLAVDLEEFSSSARFGLQDHISRRMSTLIHYRRMTRVFKVNGCCPSFRQIEVRPACCQIKPVAQRICFLQLLLVESPLIGPRTCPDQGNDAAHTLTRNAGEAAQALSVPGQVQHHWIIRPEIIVEEL